MLNREMIPHGRENAITRDALARISGLSDRAVRRDIARLRRDTDEADMVIVSTSDGRGYFRTDDLDEIRHFIAEMIRRNSSTTEIIRAAAAVRDRIKNKQMYGEGLGG